MSPIGQLILECEKKSAEKLRGEHTATASCGCQVRVSRFGPGGTSNLIQRCHEHALDPKRKKL